MRDNELRDLALAAIEERAGLPWDRMHLGNIDAELQWKAAVSPSVVLSLLDRLPLDPERLARAYHHESCPLKANASHQCRYMDAHRRSMAAVIARYALSEPVSDERREEP
jgi:hypothetical protein